MKCFMDMDGVLCDFMGAALRLHGADPAKVDHGGQWWGLCGKLGLSEGQFWAPVNAAGARFWAGLGWTPDGREILAAAEGAFGREDLCLMTAPSACPGSAAGKLEWIQRHLPAYARRYLLGPSKGFAAGPGKVLVDDGDHNCADWVEGGGAAVLVPRPWNSGHGVGDAARAVAERLGVLLATHQRVAG